VSSADLEVVVRSDCILMVEANGGLGMISR